MMKLVPAVGKSRAVQFSWKWNKMDCHFMVDVGLRQWFVMWRNRESQSCFFYIGSPQFFNVRELHNLFIVEWKLTLQRRGRQLLISLLPLSQRTCIHAAQEKRFCVDFFCPLKMFLLAYFASTSITFNCPVDDQHCLESEIWDNNMTDASELSYILK